MRGVLGGFKQSLVVEEILAGVDDLNVVTRLEGWDCAVLAYHTSLALNLPRMVALADEDDPAIDFATWAERTKGYAEGIDQMTLAGAAKRSLELTVHGIDLVSAISSAVKPSPVALAVVAAIFERLEGDRPADLADATAWVLSATGRTEHDDPRLPVLR